MLFFSASGPPNLHILQLELKDKSRSIAQLNKALEQQKELTVRNSRNTEKQMKEQMREQKTEHEQINRRHLAFIDQVGDILLFAFLYFDNPVFTAFLVNLSSL